MNWSSRYTIFDIDDVSEYLQQFTKKLWIIRYCSCMDRRTEVRAIVVLNQVVFLEMVQQRHVSD